MEKNGGSMENPVTVALNEIADGKVEWMREEPAETAPEEELDV